MSLVGLLAGWELLRLGRSGVLPRARAVLALALLAGLGIAYVSAVGTTSAGKSASLATTSRVAENYLYAYLAVQVLAVVVLTPAVAAGAISDEKERGRLDFLRSSLLTPREIVLGKYLGRVVSVFAVLATGLPVLALSMLFGGVDPHLLAAGTLVTATSVLALAAYSTSLAVRRANLREVLLVAYLNLTAATVAGLCCGWVPGVSALSPISVLAYLIGFRERPWFWLNVGGVSAVHAGVAIYYLAAAVRDLAPPAVRPVTTGEVPVYRELPPASDYRMRDPVIPSYPELSPPLLGRERKFVPMLDDDEDPLAWKEQHFSPRYTEGVGEAARGCVVLLGGAGLYTLVLIVLVAFAVKLGNTEPSSDLGRSVADLARLLTTAAVGLAMLLLATRTAASVASERERDTLTPLLAAPLDRADILWAKWLAGLRWLRYVFAAVAVAELSAVALGGTSVLAAVVVVAQVAAAAALANALGLWFSVACGTTTRAVAWSLLSLLGWVVVPVLFAALGGSAAAFSPPVGVWLAHSSPGSAVLPAVVEALAAAWLWRLARRRFEDYGK